MVKTYTKLEILAIIFSLIILGLFIYSIINYEILKQEVNDKLKNQMEKYGYTGVFVIEFLLEISPQPFASFIVPLTNGLILGLDFNLLLIITLISVTLAGLVAYFFGIMYGETIALKLVNKKTYDKYFRIFKKHGKMGMTIIALTPLPYFPIIAGIFKMKLRDFILFAVIPRIIYVIGFSYFLYLLF